MWSNISTSSSPAKASDQPEDVQIRRERTEGREEEEGEEEEEEEEEKKVDNNGNGQQKLCKLRYGSPLARYKHAICAAQASGYIYIHGGRFGNLPLDDDVWRFDPHQNSWIQLQSSGCKPPSLQEHTLVEYIDQLYLFGGQISAPSNENSFWCLNLANNQWRSLSMKSSSRYGAYLGPTNRRGHTAVLHGNSMYIYGGFEDFRGSSGQLWEYDLVNERWELRNLSASSSCHPEPRHSHSAIVYNDSMYIYGGLSNLKALGDLWRWSWRDRRWFRERTKGNAPGQLHGHTAIQAFGSMFVFGGERNGRTTRGLWRLNLSNMTWQKIRPKGPRPNPTTWHGAIANPLCILDEANYIIEGDPELILKDAQGDNCCQMSVSFEDQERTNSSEQQQPTVLAHSKSSNAAESMVSIARNGADRTRQRKSRLGFLRKSRNNGPDRPKSTYELKQMRTSLSANNFNRRDNLSSGQNNRHSVTIIKGEPPTNNTTCDHHRPVTTNQSNGTTSMDCESQPANNVGILESLDTDIKEMFQRALSPKLSQMGAKIEEDTPMSVDMSSKSHYVTARVEDSQTISSSMNQLRSQRTSYAYTTPPSEMNTLRDDGNLEQTMQETRAAKEVAESRALLISMPSGYDKRNNRPRSEIVQSLINDADARIKHLYTPHFNANQLQQPSNKLFVRRRTDEKPTSSRRGQSFLDKSKRHTIHQTMTYYNLYYSDESKSSSGDSAAGNQDSPKDADQTTDTMSKLRDIDDFGSSSTMRGVDCAYGGGATSAALIGVHQNQQSSRLVEPQQADQLSSLDSTATPHGSSDAQTLCQLDSASQLQATSDEHQATNSIQNALTARRDGCTSAESCDNTSLSFSVIAEFEEDDMFLGPVTMQNNHIDSVRRCSDDDDVEAVECSNSVGPPMTTTTNRVETMLMSEPEDQLQTVTLSDQNSGCSRMIGAGERQVVAGLTAQNKSTSSGYDSIASRGHDTPSQEVAAVDSNNRPISESREGGGGSSSIRTTESVSSSMVGGLSSATTIDTTTSPEQSAMKKLKARYQSGDSSAEQQQQQQHRSIPSADSLAAADSFDSPTAGSMSKNVADSSSYCSPATTNIQARSEATAAKQQRQKVPLMSRSRFFGRSSSKSRYWQLCMFVIGGKQGQGSQGVNEPITVWRLYI